MDTEQTERLFDMYDKKRTFDIKKTQPPQQKINAYRRCRRNRRYVIKTNYKGIKKVKQSTYYM